MWSSTIPVACIVAYAVVGVCFESGTPITTQGGNTGLVGGQIPMGEILLSTERLNRIRDVDAFDDVLTAEAGVTLAAVYSGMSKLTRTWLCAPRW